MELYSFNIDRSEGESLSASLVFHLLSKLPPSIDLPMMVLTLLEARRSIGSSDLGGGFGKAWWGS